MCGYEVNMNMLIFDFERKSIFKRTSIYQSKKKILYLGSEWCNGYPLARNQWMPVNRVFLPRQKLPLFPREINFTTIAQYWLAPGEDWCVIKNKFKLQNSLLTNRNKLNQNTLLFRIRILHYLWFRLIDFTDRNPDVIFLYTL